MSYLQTIAVRDSTASLDIASNQVTGDTLICPLQTTGDLTIGGSSGRTAGGAITIGDAAGLNPLNVYSGNVDIASKGAMNIACTGNTVADRDLVVEAQGADATTWLGATTTSSDTQIGFGAISDKIIIGESQVGGQILIGRKANRTATIEIGVASASHQCNIYCNEFHVEGKVSTNVTSAVGGFITVGTQSSRTGAITIGNSAASNTTTVEGGTVDVTAPTIVLDATTTMDFKSSTPGGTITIGKETDRTGVISVGHPSAPNTTTIAGGTVSITGPLIELDAVNNVDIITDTGGTITVGTEVGRTGDITIGNNAATGSEIFIKGVSMKRTSGTFSPLVQAGGTTFNTSGNSGSWWIWGGFMTIWVQYSWADQNSATGTVRVTGLSLVNTGQDVYAQMASTGFVDTPGTVENNVAIVLSKDDLFLRLIETSGTGSTTELIETDVLAAGAIKFSMIYPIG